MKTEKRISRPRRIIGGVLLALVLLLIADVVAVIPHIIIGDILLALALLLTADVTAIMLRKINAAVLKAVNREIFLYELILCATLLLFALDLRFCLFTWSRNLVMRTVGWALRIAVILFSAVILFFFGRIAVGSLICTADRADHALVLGLALEKGEPAPDLLRRLDTAQAYLEEYPEAQLILTGGNADESGRTEAAVMRELLAGRGVPEERMILEDQAQTTKENFANTVRMLPADAPIVLISSNYHMDRAARTARNAGFSNILRLPAPSSPLSYGANVMYEIVLEINELTFKR
ncbi:MAG: YdcF family protein [Oscillospiraceae bacterium]|nr:YdcF family protein [Oscillospiraceae bacterium]